MSPVENKCRDTDPALDGHYNIATEVSIEQQKPGYPKGDVSTLCNQLVLEDERKQLCRLCGQKGSLLRPIFDSSSETVENISLATKLDRYLPFKIKMDDPLPSHICLQCFEVLNRWHELYVTSVSADAALWKTFGGKYDVSQRNLDFLTNRHQENVYQCANISDQVDMECHEVTTPVDANEVRDGVEALNNVKVEQEALLSVCDMNTSSTPKEGMPNEEFESFHSCVRSVKYKCKYCYEIFSTYREKKDHLKNCRELSTVCEICGKRDIRRKRLQRHKYSIHQKVVVTRVCDKCGLCFKSLSAFKRHVYIDHGQGRVPKFYCKLCCTAFAIKEKYEAHLKNHEKGLVNTEFQFEKLLEGEGAHTCPICDETFSDTLSLVVHLTSEKKLRCPSCRALKFSEKKLMLHVCREWECRYCPRKYRTRPSWIIHERLHTGEKPIKCRVCEMTFRSFQKRARHEAKHAPAFQCSFCGKKFRTKSIFEDHVQRHEGRVFSCSICQKQFSSRRYIAKHMGIFHKSVKTV